MQWLTGSISAHLSPVQNEFQVWSQDVGFTDRPGIRIVRRAELVMSAHSPQLPRPRP